MSSNHNKRGSSRAALQRKSTRGPLDTDDSPSTPHSLSPSLADPLTSSLTASSELDDPLIAPSDPSHGTPEIELLKESSSGSKDLSFLLDASIYHPLSTIEIPPPFRQPLPPVPTANTTLAQIFADLKRLLKQCHFLSAAHLAAAALTSGHVQPTDSSTIFRLLSIRYSALELSGNVVLAAQESKGLEDLSSSFYYEDQSQSAETLDLLDKTKAVPKHIMPFDLRLQALRLQGIGFGDSRRAIGALFDLGMECRENLGRENAQGKALWEERLREVGIRVVNALIDMGDFDCAKRTLKSLTLDNPTSDTQWTARTILLQIRMGEVDEAHTMLENSESDSPNYAILKAFIEIADGEFEKATETLSQASSEAKDAATVAMARQNLAVAYLYIGKINKSQEILQSLVDEGYSFQALTVNLATLYDLTSDKSNRLKTDLAGKIANMRPTQTQRGFVNADFKL